MKHFILTALLTWMAMPLLHAEDADKKPRTDAHIVGHVIDATTGEHVPGVSLFIKGTTIGTVTDQTGHYRLMDMPLGTKTLVMKAVGYKTQEKEIALKKGTTQEVNFFLEEDIAALDAVVVSANRTETTRRLAPTLVNVIDAKVFSASNSNNLAQGIIFQPGVRVENNCQNCGFNQVRINGMEGRYTQILIDSRPIMSALAGVYGLEQIPTNMIERVEVVRGGGSALYGSSAIAGVLNIITKEPMQNSFMVNESLGFTGMKKLDNNLSFNGSIVSDDQRAGAMFFGQMRKRNAWDKDGDGFSELGEIDARSLGTHLFLRTSDYSRLTAEVHGLQEDRRGGDHVDDAWPEHVVGVAEATRHSVYSGNLKYDLRSADSKHHFQAYASAQLVGRKSYYGGIGDLGNWGTLGNPVPKESYGENYGVTKGKTYMGGAQYSYNFDKFLFMPAQVLVGAEYTRDMLNDIMPIRSWTADNTGKSSLYPELDQRINNWSQFAQVEWKNKQWSILAGVRVDEHSEVDDIIVSPRATVRFNPIEDINLRATYAKGFRAPQVFDEDLHVAVVGGESQKIKNAANLKPEISHAFSLSADVYHRFGEVQTNLLVEGFYNRLKDAFNTEIDQPQPNDGILHKTRVNSNGAKIVGANIEAKLAYRRIQLQAGLTLTSSQFDEAEEWGERTVLTSGDVPAADGANFKQELNDNGNQEYVNEGQSDRAMTRTPNAYGYFTFGWNPFNPLTVSLTGTFTGKMKVPHAIEWGAGSALADIEGIAKGTRKAGVVDGEGNAPHWDMLETTPSFFDLGAKVAYDFRLTTATRLQLYAGLNNLLNSFQKDYDKYAGRDSGYIYGPTQPRSMYVGCKFSF